MRVRRSWTIASALLMTVAILLGAMVRSDPCEFQASGTLAPTHSTYALKTLATPARIF